MASLKNHTPENYNANASFVYSDQFTSPILGLLNPQPGEIIADLGCGTGELTAKIVAAVGGTGTVVGFDSSEKMLEGAGKKLPGVQLIKSDIQKLSSTVSEDMIGKFDAVFTSATLHWCKEDPFGVLVGMTRLLKPGGRIAFEFGGFGNIVGVRGAIHHVLKSRGHDALALDPWYFPRVEQYTQLLLKAGFKVTGIQLVPRLSPLDTDFLGWLRTFARNTCFASFKDEEAEEMMKEVEALVTPDCYWSDEAPGAGAEVVGEERVKGKNGWELMYVRLRGTAVLPV